MLCLSQHGKIRESSTLSQLGIVPPIVLYRLANSVFPYQEEKDENVLRAADRQMKLLRILKDGIVLKVMNVKEELTGKNVPESNLKDELSVMLVANLQEKQNTESRAVENILAEKV